jgi:flagellar biosynthesis chaperone FliJ
VKKFVWRLQRLLDIKIKQEGAMRAELVAVTERALAVRSEIMVRKAALRKLLSDLGAKQAQERLSEQEFFLKYAYVSDAKIEKLEVKLAELERVRQSKVQEIMKIRRFRKGLERLRAEAKAEFVAEQEKLQQKDMDAKTIEGFARKVLQPT